MNHPNDIDCKRIEKAFASPFPDKVRNIVEKTKGGYILTETKPPWDNPNGPWTRLPVTKLLYVTSTGMWKVYWMRASGRWKLYEKYSSLHEVIEIIKSDRQECFWS